MGNSISSSNVVPRSLIECFNSDGEFDIGLWFLYRSNQRRLSSDPLQDAILFAQNEELEQQSTKSHSYPRVHDPLLVTLPSGERKKAIPILSPWYLLYIQQPELSSDRFHRLFRQRFRLPYTGFQEILSKIKDDDLFIRWHQYQHEGGGRQPSSPL